MSYACSRPTNPRSTDVDGNGMFLAIGSIAVNVILVGYVLIRVKFAD